MPTTFSALNSIGTLAERVAALPATPDGASRALKLAEGDGGLAAAFHALADDAVRALPGRRHSAVDRTPLRGELARFGSLLHGISTLEPGRSGDTFHDPDVFGTLADAARGLGAAAKTLADQHDSRTADRPVAQDVGTVVLSAAHNGLVEPSVHLILVAMQMVSPPSAQHKHYRFELSCVAANLNDRLVALSNKLSALAL
jgi:hypothetical protein